MNVHDRELGLPKEIAETVENAVRANPDAIVTVLSSEGMFLYVAPSSKDILGYEPDEVEGRMFTDFYDPIDAAHVSLAFHDTILSGESLVTTRVVRMKSGARKRMRGSGQRLTDLETGAKFILSISRVAD
jgi:PAS domain S-box-containing protein